MIWLLIYFYKSSILSGVDSPFSGEIFYWHRQATLFWSRQVNKLELLRIVYICNNNKTL